MAYVRRNNDTFWHKKIPVINLLLVVLCLLGNSVSNVGFCRPVAWAAVLQGVCFLNIISFTWVERTRLRGVNALLCGISTGVYAYWCLFLEGWLLLMPAPLWFLVLLVWRNLVHPVSRWLRIWYLAGMLLCLLFAVGCKIEYQSACKAWDEGRVPNGNPMTERIAGMHFLYHTRICIYDGWRPPLHDPAMVLGMRLNGSRDPLQGMQLKDRVEMYRNMYPGRPVVLPCACCLESALNGYFTDSLWE
ncbi:MAG: hypothetical protein IJ785_03030 [Bacteroidales bacterium]|nr:hypothetical protein [Bacteroidales bacterium]